MLSIQVASRSCEAHTQPHPQPHLHPYRRIHTRKNVPTQSESCQPHKGIAQQIKIETPSCKTAFVTHTYTHSQRCHSQHQKPHHTTPHHTTDLRPTTALYPAVLHCCTHCQPHHFCATRPPTCTYLSLHFWQPWHPVKG
jgi:hypothetical protein